MYQMMAFVTGFLGAVTLYVLLIGPQRYLTRKKHWNSSLSATMLMLLSFILLLVPFGLIAQMLIAKISSQQINTNELTDGLKAINDRLYEYTKIDLLSDNIISKVESIASNLMQSLLSGTYSFIFNLVIMYFLLYFMLKSNKSMERQIKYFLPFNQENTHLLGHEMRDMVYSNAIGIPVLAVLQGIVAIIGYFIFGVNEAIFWGIITGVFSIIPVVGTAAIWLPLGVYLLSARMIWQGIGLLLFGGLIITNIDNVFRLMLQKKLSNVHPVITILGVIIGVQLFGFMGVIFGPLLISAFFILINIYRKEYIAADADNENDDF
jgi:predicted PurR-regulated permease PerM